MLFPRFLAILEGVEEPDCFLAARVMRWSLVLWGMVLGTVLSIFSWGSVLFFINPASATLFEWALFLATLFLSLAGLCSLVTLVIRRAVFGNERALSRVGTSIRQGAFLAVFCIGVLFLFRAGWFAWWNVFFLFGFLFLIELFFLRHFRIKH